MAARSVLSEGARRRAGQALAEAVLPLTVAAGRLAAYVSVGSEPSTRPLLDALAGRSVLLPVLLPGGELDWADAAAGLVPGPGGLLEPAGPRLGPGAARVCDLVLVPALAVDRGGVRLGRGGGSYDRALSGARGRVVALLHDGELVDALPAEPHDVPVHAVVTPSGGVLAVGTSRQDRTDRAGPPGEMGP